MRQAIARFTLALPLFAALLLASVAPVAHAQFDFLTKLASKIQISSDNTSLDPMNRTARAVGNVNIRYENVQITSDRAEYHESTGDIIAMGNVSVYKDGQVFRGEKMVYNTETRQVSSDRLRSSFGPVLFDANEYSGSNAGGENQVLKTKGTTFTTHDSASPNYRIVAKEVDIHPGDKIVFRGAKFYLGNSPVLYLPYFVQQVDNELGYYFQPGYNSYWGGYILNRYGFMMGENTIASLNLDYRSGRGVAGGVEFRSQRFRKNPNYGRLKLYYAQDSDPTYAVSSLARDELDQGRYRANLQHRVYLPGPEESSLYLDLDINKLSDELFYEDFFFSAFQIDPKPDNLVNLVKNHERFTLSAMGRFQLNDFFRRDERLPEVALDFTTQPLGNSGFFYRGNTSAGLLTDARTDEDLVDLFDSANTPENRLLDEDGDEILDENENPTLIAYPDFGENSFTRLHTYHELLFPMELGALKLTPRVGAGVTKYSGIEGDIAQGDLTRDMFGWGVMASTKFSKVWTSQATRNPMRHIVQPYVNYSFLEADDLRDTNFRPIDRWLGTTRLRPIDVSLVTGIDELRSWNIVRTGLRHLVQTQRDGQTANIFGLNTYIDSYIDDPEFTRDISNLYNDLFWNPVPQFRLNIDSQIPLGDNPGNYTEINSRVTWMPGDSFSISAGHLFLQDHPFFDDSSRFSLSTYARLGENWGFSTFHSYEQEDGTMEFQTYRIHRDLSSWTASLGAMIIGSREEGEDDFVGVMMMFSLKDFPEISIPIDFNPDPAAW